MILSAYIHIPFCSQKCDFCDFAAYAGLLPLEDQYCQVVCEEINKRLEQLDTKPTLTSIFYGGGTPGLVKPANLAKIHNTLLGYVSCVDDMEVNLETTPHAITKAKAQEWLEIGINRLSIGVESLQDEELQAIGRDHNCHQAVNGIKIACQAGFSNINCDLMYGLPGQDLDSWRKSIQDLILLACEYQQIKHVSAYALELAHHSPLLMRFPKDSKAYPPESEVVKMYEILVDLLGQAGFKQYEIANFSQSGFQSIHNLNYWNNGEYFAFGVGAHRYFNGCRSSNWRSFNKYIEDPFGNETSEFIDQTTRLNEAMMLGLRKIDGIDLAAFKDDYGINILEKYAAKIDKLKTGGFVRLLKGKLSLSDKGILVSNSVIAEFI